MNEKYDNHILKIMDSSKAILDVPSALFNNRDFLLKATSVNGYVYKFLPQTYQKEKDFIDAVFSSTEDLSILNNNFFSNFEVCLKFCIKNLTNFVYVDNNLKANEQFILEVSKKSPSIVLFMDENLLNNKFFIHDLVYTNPLTYCFIKHEDKINPILRNYILHSGVASSIGYIPADTFTNVYELSDFLYCLQKHKYIESIIKNTSKKNQIILNLLKNSIFSSFMTVKNKKDILSFLSKDNYQDYQINNDDIFNFLMHSHNIYYIYELINHLESSICKIETHYVNEDTKNNFVKF